MLPKPFLCLFAGVVLLRGLTALAEDKGAKVSRWPAFQGPPSADLRADHLPLAWAPGQNIAWKADVPGYGQSSPVVWEGRVYVTSVAGRMKEKCHVSAFDLASGENLWQFDLAAASQTESSNYVSKAAPTPVADSRGVIALFESGNLVALTPGGELRWQRDLVAEYGAITARHGLGSSLEQDEEQVFIWIERQEDPYILAVSKKTGKTIWKGKGLGAASWSSPRLVPVGDGRHVVLSGIGKLAGIDPETGQRLWDFDDISGNSIPTPMPLGDNRFLIGATVGRGEGGGNAAASNGVVQIDELDDGSFEASFSWRAENATSSFGSPIVAGANAYFVNRAGVVYCLDAKTGKQHYAQRTAGSVWATPLHVGDRIYLFGRNGTTTVIREGDEFEVLATNLLWKEEAKKTETEPGQAGSAASLGGPALYAAVAVGDRIVLRRGDRLYCVAASHPAKPAPPTSKSSESKDTRFADLPKAITSFGAAVIGDSLYAYGGHHGKAHHYSTISQSDVLLRLNLAKPTKWEVIAKGPRLQGLAMVTHGGKLYRLGGFTARNAESEDHDLWSQAEVARFDPETKQWTELPPLPEGRSSFDAAVLGGKIFVIGGWRMAGDQEHKWHKSAYVLDLAANELRWKALPEPPFQRRALAVAAHAGKIYAIGGMRPDAGPTKRVDIFDPLAGKWSRGPDLQGEKMDGFGASAFATGGRLYGSTYSGKLQRLARDGTSWQVVRELERARFFHRMLPLSGSRLVLLGGANMEAGRFDQVDVFEVR